MGSLSFFDTVPFWLLLIVNNRSSSRIGYKRLRNRSVRTEFLPRSD
jgi:hypothetical protein